MKRIDISKKTGMPIVEKEEEEEEEEEGEMAPVENLGEKRNKRETKEEKKLADRKKAVGKSGSTFKMN